MSHLPLLPAVPTEPPLSDILADLRDRPARLALSGVVALWRPSRLELVPLKGGHR